ncbi:hypothetical protein KI688_002089 [Linnemannia hyalina]|uniref:Uncharacterized protein n=1 Tax=Linnemannia hyalina TaxID=64524 RepID=A0A9P7XRJ8_9FUNG|nr:hypothetical protein KI688_002089 [Linnemannia hyalina]
MSAQAVIYVSAFLGMTVLMGLFAGLIYRRHRMMVDQHRAYERMAQERIRQAQDENLPPFYIDHVRDRACVFEGEPPPDNTFLRMLEVVVVRPRRQESMQDLVDAGIVPPGTGNTEAGSGIETEGLSEATSNSPHSHHRRNLSSTLGLPDLIVSEMPHLGLGITVVESGVIRPTPATLRRPTRAMTPNNTPTALAAAVLVPPVPTSAVAIHGDSNRNDMGDGQESIHTLPPPPSYDITRTHATTGIAEPNSIAHLVSAPSATGDFFTHHLHHHHSHTHTQQDNNQQQASTPSSSAVEQQLSSPSSTPIDAPRYSDEFPSHITHEQHLEGYRSARAISNVSLRQQDGSPSLSAAAATFVDQTTNAAAAVAPTESSPLSSSPSSLSSSAQSPFPAETLH